MVVQCSEAEEASSPQLARGSQFPVQVEPDMAVVVTEWDCL